MNFNGDSRLGPYLTLTLFFLSDKKISSELTNEKEDNKKNVANCFLVRIVWRRCSYYLFRRDFNFNVQRRNNSVV